MKLIKRFDMKKFSPHFYKNNSKMEYKFRDSLSTNLKGFNQLLIFMEGKLGNDYVSWKSSYMQKLRDVTTSESKKSLDKLNIKFENDIENNFAEAYSSLVNLIQYNTDIFEIEKTDLLRGFLHPSFFAIKALEEIIGKKDAIKIYKLYVDYYVHKNRENNKLNVVDDFLSINTSWPEIFKNSFDAQEFAVEQGKVGVKIKKCKWATVLNELNDPEVAYAAACYYDYPAAKAANSNFELTRTKTIVKGDNCCDFIWHDKRVVKEVNHPDKSFWDSL